MGPLSVLNIIGYVETILFLLAIIWAGFYWWKGIFPALLRLGNGLSKRKIAIFARGDELTSLKSLIIDSKIFNNDIIEITSKQDFGKAEKATIYLVFWPDWQQEMQHILSLKTDGTAFIVYAPQQHGFISKEVMAKINEVRNATVTNFRGRLINDIVSFMITTAYEK